MTDLDAAALRDVYDAQLRAWMPPKLPPGAVVERDGPLVRVAGLDQRGFVTYQTLGGVDGAELDALIARQRDHFAARGEAVEWKLHGHDLPADLAERLVAAGFVPEEPETVVIGLAAPLAEAKPAAAPLAEAKPAAVPLREVTARRDLDRLATMEGIVWNDPDRSYQAQALEDEIAADPDSIVVVVAEPSPDEPVVSAGWVRFYAGTAFATLWGGSTLPEWRGRGIYMSLVRYRAALAVARGFTYLQVDASDNSRPILQRHGFVAVTTTTPYVHPAP